MYCILLIFYTTTNPITGCTPKLMSLFKILNKWSLNTSVLFVVRQSRLLRHISTVHKTEPQVKKALKSPSTSVEHIHKFAQFQKESIDEKTLPGYTDSANLPKRKVPVICAALQTAKDFTARNNSTSINRHANTTVVMKHHLQFLWKSMNTTEDKYTTEIFAKFHDDEVGKNVPIGSHNCSDWKEKISKKSRKDTQTDAGKNIQWLKWDYRCT